MLQKQLIRFLLAGGANTIFGFLIYSILIFLGISVWAALLLAMAIGIAFNFFTIGGYVFRQLALKRLPRFVMAYALIYLSNLKLIDWLSNWISGSILVQAILTLPMALFAFILMKKFVFPHPSTHRNSPNV